MYAQVEFLPQILEYSTMTIDRDQLTLFVLCSLVELIIVVLGTIYHS